MASFPPLLGARAVRGGRRRQGEGKARSCCYHRITPAKPTTKKAPIFALNPSTKHRKITTSYELTEDPTVRTMEKQEFKLMQGETAI